MIYSRQVLASPCFACVLVIAASGAAVGQESGPVARTTASVSNPAGKSVEPSRVLRLKQKDGLEVTVVVSPDTATVWHFHDKVVSHVVGDKLEYPPHLDKQKKRLAIQPIANASPTNLNVETKARMTFHLVLASDGQIPVSMVIIEPPEPESESRGNGPEGAAKPEQMDRTIEQVEDHFATYPPKTARFEMGGYVLVGQVTEQHRQGDTLTCRYTVRNEGLHYPVARTLITPPGSLEPLDAVIVVDGDKDFPLELHHGNVISGSIHVREGASLLEKGFVLRFLPTRMDVLPAPMGFKDPPINVRRLAVHAHGTLGAISLENGNNAEQNDFTILRGAGAMAVYGMTGNLSAEGALSVLASGDARFDDDSTADAVSVRALLGLRAHVGETYVPYARIGLGFRLGKYTWRPTTGEEASELQGSAVVGIAAGFEAWVGKSFVMGISAGYMAPFGGDDESFAYEAGAHAGFAWQLGPRWY